MSTSKSPLGNEELDDYLQRFQSEINTDWAYGVTPAILRDMADRLEELVKMTGPGERVFG